MTSAPAALATPGVSAPVGPEITAGRYLAAWQARDLAGMAALVAEPPADFAERHRRFDDELRVTSLSITPGGLRRPGEGEAELPFSGVREVAGLGRPWAFSSRLRLGLRDGVWKVL